MGAAAPSSLITASGLPVFHNKGAANLWRVFAPEKLQFKMTPSLHNISPFLLKWQARNGEMGA